MCNIREEVFCPDKSSQVFRYTSDNPVVFDRLVLDAKGIQTKIKINVFVNNNFIHDENML